MKTYIVKIALNNGETFTETTETDKARRDVLTDTIKTYEIRYPENEIVSAEIQEG